MDDKLLLWTMKEKHHLLHTPIFDVESMQMHSATGITGDYVAIKAPDWMVVIAVDGEDFILVRQWRFGCAQITTEFPAGLVDEGETPEECAYRELLEETGYRAGKITVLGTCCPNTAFFSNQLTVCLAEDLTATGVQHLDADEVISYIKVPIHEVIEKYCTGEFVHAYMGTALALYMRNRIWSDLLAGSESEKSNG